MALGSPHQHIASAMTAPLPTHLPAGSDALVDEIAATEELLGAVRVRQVAAIAAWALANTVEVDGDVCTSTERGLDTGLPVAGDGAPLISDFAVTELAAVLGRSLDSGRAHVGQVVELSARLPRTWRRTLASEVPTWKSLRIAELTRSLGPDAADFVDRHLAPVAHGCGWAQVDRLVEAALARFEPEVAEERRRAAAEQRRFDVRLEEAGVRGTVHVDGVLDTADALDLDRAVALRARELGQLGSTDSRDVRRSRAVGELARADLTLDLTDTGTDKAPGDTRPRRPRGRRIDLHVHLAHTALAAPDATQDGADVGRLGDLAVPVTVEQVRAWCGSAATIVVRPVLDLADCAPVDAYEIPERQRRRVELRNPRCVFPHCTRRAERCDTDHVTPYDAGGATCPCNLAPLCRPHHRAKTHGRWHYVPTAPGRFRWTGPSGRGWVTDPVGTTRPGSPPAPPPPRRTPAGAAPPTG